MLKMNLSVYSIIHRGWFLHLASNLLVVKSLPCKKEARFGYRVRIIAYYNNEQVQQGYTPNIVVFDKNTRELLGMNAYFNINMVEFFFDTISELETFKSRTLAIIDTALCEEDWQTNNIVVNNGRIVVVRQPSTYEATLDNFHSIKLFVPSFEDSHLCIICLDPMRCGLRSCFSLDCEHSFHVACMPPPSKYEEIYDVQAKYLLRKLKCPLCREITFIATHVSELPVMYEEENAV